MYCKFKGPEAQELFKKLPWMPLEESPMTKFFEIWFFGKLAEAFRGLRRHAFAKMSVSKLCKSPETNQSLPAAGVCDCLYGYTYD